MTSRCHECRSMRRSFRPRLVALLLAVVLFSGATAVWAAKKHGEIIGKVVDPSEMPIPGVLVTLTAPDRPDFKLVTTADRQGEFTLKVPKATGSYAIHLEGMGYETFTATLALEAGDQQNVQFRLIGQAASRMRDAVLAYNAGALAFEAGDFEIAKKKFREAAELDSSLAEPHLGLTDILLREGDYQAAAVEVEKLLALAPEHAQGRRLAYEIYRRLGDDARAEEALTAMKGTDMAGGLAVQTYNEGVAALQRGEEDQAIDRFLAALELNGELVEAHGALATLYYNQERYEEALAATDRLLEIDPDHVQGRRVRFLIWDARNDPLRSKEALEAYRQVDPAAAAEILYRRADLDYRAGDVASAKAALLQVLEMQPDMPRAHYTLGLCYASESNSAKAKEHLQRFLDLAPGDSEASTAKEMLSYL